MLYGQKLLLGDTIREDRLFRIRISRSFSGVMVCGGFWFPSLPGACIKVDFLGKESSTQWSS